MGGHTVNRKSTTDTCAIFQFSKCLVLPKIPPQILRPWFQWYFLDLKGPLDFSEDLWKFLTASSLTRSKELLRFLRHFVTFTQFEAYYVILCHITSYYVILRHITSCLTWIDTIVSNCITRDTKKCFKMWEKE